MLAHQGFRNSEQQNDKMMKECRESIDRLDYSDCDIVCALVMYLMIKCDIEVSTEEDLRTIAEVTNAVSGIPLSRLIKSRKGFLIQWFKTNSRKIRKFLPQIAVCIQMASTGGFAPIAAEPGT
jgi:hypothetical protein